MTSWTQHSELYSQEKGSEKRAYWRFFSPAVVFESYIPVALHSRCVTFFPWQGGEVVVAKAPQCPTTGPRLSLFGSEILHRKVDTNDKRLTTNYSKITVRSNQVKHFLIQLRNRRLESPYILSAALLHSAILRLPSIYQRINLPCAR